MSYLVSESGFNHGLLHTPEGVRDIYNGECEQKLRLQESIHDIIKLYGFRDIQTPTFEFFDIFNKERGTTASREMYKFFDREGNTLVLRPDITPSIARCVAKYYKEEELPIRLCYQGNTFINNTSYQGKLKETTQLGTELFNDGSSDADAEMIALLVNCLKKAGLKEFQVEIGHADFFLGLLEEADFDQEEAEQLKVLIEKKNLFGVEELVSSKKLDENLKELILKLPDLFGNLDNLLYAKKMIKNQRSVHAIEHLEKLYAILELYGFSEYITFDLGMLSKYNYYTGIIFRALSYGSGEAIATGGRYDNLVEQFGKKAKAIGFVILIDQLMTALSRQKVLNKASASSTLILYHSQYRKMAIDLANHFRGSGMKLLLMRMSNEKEMVDYVDYCKRQSIGGILLMKDADTIEVIDISSGGKKITQISEMLS
ncbi:ATP phosphoribosyltransferase regulatory subunit [Anaeromicropila populeti]|uniref:ATP phosphoribosyltransferase regulatory subunit n=1 Tax=Anaeromicropila populeti TaxID=37658 RepID=A0A1I6KY53_9FIRM|nr:ATP phosphoribosyltransferase regulatory subunit [Anaeromicropila populeti]SFR96134.1 ATP phosphoribosyltransferase regulatory subunit [Anaeromicropila populeti]